MDNSVENVDFMTRAPLMGQSDKSILKDLKFIFLQNTVWVNDFM